MQFNHLIRLLCRVVIVFSILLLINCGGEPPGQVEVVQHQAQNIFKSAQEFGNGLIAVVNEQVIKPFLLENPVKPDNVEVGFTPKYVPVRIAVDNNGNVLISGSSILVTDVGVFDVGVSKQVISQEQDNLLIIQIDDEIVVYNLSPQNNNETIEVDFSDKYSKYRILLFKQETNGDIFLQLETL